MSRKLSLPAVALFSATLMLFAVPVPADSAAPAKDKTAVASCQRCGDGYCARSCENEQTCPADCAPKSTVKLASCSKCGDGRCTPQCGETSETCPADCGVGSPSKASADATAKDCAKKKE